MYDAVDYVSDLFGYFSRNYAAGSVTLGSVFVLFGLTFGTCVNTLGVSVRSRNALGAPLGA